MSASPPPTVSWESPEQEAGPAPGVQFAPHGERLVAYILDSIIVTIVIVVFLVIGSALLVSGATVEGDEVTSVSPVAGAGFSIFLVLGIIVAFLYFPFFWARGGQTLGMRPFGLRGSRPGRRSDRLGRRAPAAGRPVDRRPRLLHRVHLDLHRQAPPWLAGPDRRDGRRQTALTGISA
jgi:hypothetical protein